MGLRPGSPPGVEVARVGFRSHLVDEGMCGSPKPAVGGEGDGAKLDVEPLVIDDLVGGLVLGLGVDVGGGTTCSLTRRLIDVGVDGGVCDADVRNRFALREQADGGEVALPFAPLAGST